jgi:homeobox protein cut-like
MERSASIAFYHPVVLLTVLTGINLAALIPQLDSTATEIVMNQRDALVERKELAQKTKDFRKLDDAAKLSEFKSLLRGWCTIKDAPSDLFCFLTLG